MSDSIPVNQITVNYSMFGIDDAYPIIESIGTLIFANNGHWYVKDTEMTCRLATADEIANWTGETSPWFINVQNLNAFRHKRLIHADSLPESEVDQLEADLTPTPT